MFNMGNGGREGLSGARPISGTCFLLAKGLLEYEKITGQGWIDHLLPENDGD